MHEFKDTPVLGKREGSRSRNSYLCSSFLWGGCAQSVCHGNMKMMTCQFNYRIVCEEVLGVKCMG